MKRILAVIRKEFFEAYQDKRVFSIMIIAPILQIIAFGYVVTTEVRDIPFIYAGYSPNYRIREIIRKLDESEVFRYVGNSSKFEIDKVFRKNQAIFVILGGEKRGVQLIMDGTQPLRVQVALSYLEETFKGREFMKYISVKFYFNPGLKSRIYMVPGVIVLVTLIMTVVLTAVSVVREYELGTLEQILISPVKTHEFLLGKVIFYVSVSFVHTILVSLIAVSLFNLPIKGSITLPLLSFLFFSIGNVGIALVVSVVSKTQTEAMLTSFFFILPMILLSGLFFPIMGMPPFFQKIAWINPVSHILYIIRTTFIKGFGFQELKNNLLFLLMYGFLTFFIAYRLFHERRVRGAD